MIKSIIKRDGRVGVYDEGKIASAILKAMEAAQEGEDVYKRQGQTSGGNLWNFHVLFAVQPLSEG